MSLNFTIARLQDYPQFAEICSAWDDETWPRNADNEEFFADHYHDAAHNQGTTAPQVWIALNENEQPIGMISLITDDHPDYLHISPWLASAFVLPQYRRRGVFRALHDHMVQAVKNQKRYTTLHVYSHIDFPHLGNWVAVQEIPDPFEDKTVTLFKHDL